MNLKSKIEVVASGTTLEMVRQILSKYVRIVRPIFWESRIHFAYHGYINVNSLLCIFIVYLYRGL